MKLIEIGIYPGRGAPADIRRTLPVYDALTREVSLQKIEAPFKKLVVKLTTSADEERCWSAPVGGILEVSVAVGELFTAPFEALSRGVLDAVKRALTAVEAALGWSAAPVLAIVDELAARPRLHRYELTKLGKLHRASGRRARVFFAMTDVDSALSVQIDDGAETIIAQTRPPTFLQYWRSPAKSLIDGDAFVLLDAQGAEIGRVPFV